MSDAAVTALVAGFVQITVIVVGFFTLLVKLRYSANDVKASAVKAEETAAKAVIKAEVVESKIDATHATTEAVNQKADTIVDQTNGSLDRVRTLVARIAERVDKLEDYNRDASHRMLDAINAVHLKVAELAAIQGGVPPVTAPKPKDKAP